MRKQSLDAWLTLAAVALLAGACSTVPIASPSEPAAEMAPISTPAPLPPDASTSAGPTEAPPPASPVAAAPSAVTVSPTAIAPTTAAQTATFVPTRSPSVTDSPTDSQPTPAPTAGSAQAATPAVAWRLGGRKEAEGSLFQELGGLDVAGDRVYVADAFRGAYVFDLDGALAGMVSAGEIGYVTDVKVGAAGVVYLADAGLHQVTRFSAAGELLGAFGGRGSGAGEFGTESPRALAVSPAGEVFVLDRNVDAAAAPVVRVQVFSATGDYLRSFPAEPGEYAGGMDVGPDGTLFIVSHQGYVAEQEPENGRLLVRTGQRVLDGAWPQMIGIDDAGNLYVTTQIPAAAAIIDPLGNLITWIGEEGVRTDEGWPEGEFLFPVGVAVTGDGGRILIGDTDQWFAYVTAFYRPMQR